MAFRTFCDIKGCRSEMIPVIDKESKKVYCTTCNGEINCVDEFMKRQMIVLGQVKKIEKRGTAYAVACKDCSKTGQPTVKNNKAYCQYCSKEMSYVPAPFIQLLKTMGTKKPDNDV